MAVQAQCSSNILLLNRTILQDQIGINNNYSLPSVATTVLDHQTLNHHPVENSSNMNQFMSNVHQHSQMQSRNVDVSTGLRLAFNDHHQQQQQHSSQDLLTLINQQGDEMEHYLQVQGEELRRKLAEKRQRHYHALIGAAKESASRMIKEKEVTAERAARRNAELEARAAQLSTEAQVWQAKAAAQEAVAVALKAELQQAIAGVGGGGCVSQAEEVGAEDAESSYIDPERVVVVSGPGCKACGKRVASVVLLPCRHLCVCSECDDVVQACPLCLSFRSSSIEVYMS